MSKDRLTCLTLRMISCCAIVVSGARWFTRAGVEMLWLRKRSSRSLTNSSTYINHALCVKCMYVFNTSYLCVKCVGNVRTSLIRRICVCEMCAKCTYVFNTSYLDVVVAAPFELIRSDTETSNTLLMFPRLMTHNVIHWMYHDFNSDIK